MIVFLVRQEKAPGSAAKNRDGWLTVNTPIVFFASLDLSQNREYILPELLDEKHRQ